MFLRVVLKLSGEAIGSSGSNGIEDSPTGYNDRIVDSIVRQVTACVQGGTQFALVVGGGNFWRGHQARPDMNRVKADQMGMLATVMNALYLEEAFKRAGQEAKTITPITIGNFTTPYEMGKALELMGSGVVIINAAGLGHPYFSTDTVTALRAAELGADCVLFAKNIDGVYDSDPSINPNARKFKTLSYKTAIKKDLKAADQTAIQLLSEAALPAYVFGLGEHLAIENAINYPNTRGLEGTFINVNAEEDFYAAS